MVDMSVNEIAIATKEQGLIINIQEGYGDQLDDEDIQEGYVDYIDFTSFRVDDDGEWEEWDGGIVMLKEPIREHYKGDFDKVVVDVLDQIATSSVNDYGYIVLHGDTNKLVA